MNIQESDKYKFEQAWENLPRMQKEVLLMLLKGTADALIAKSLSKKPGTVRTQISQICKAFGLTNPVGERRSRRGDLLALFAKYKPELLELPDDELLATSKFLVSEERDFEIEHPAIESLCQEEILKPGALLSIKAPPKMGKTLLISRLLNFVTNKGYRTVDLKLRLAQKSDFENLDTFLQWFCISVTEMLNLENLVLKHWEKQFGNSKLKCMTYFEDHLLPEELPLVLGLDDLDRIFPYPTIAYDFLGLLRTCHEKAKTSSIWRKLRLILAHTGEYIQLDIDQSPFNAGIQIELPEFKKEQVQDLTQKHELSWNTAQVEQLMAMVGGHPYLVEMAIEQIKCQYITLEQLLQDAPTEAGIYGEHLRENLRNLQAHSKLDRELELDKALKKVVTTDDDRPVKLNWEQTLKLDELGLVKRKNNGVIPRCNLYRLYFQEYFRDNP